MGEGSSPGQGKGPIGEWCTVRPVTIASAAAPSRLLAPALAAASIVVFLLAGRAEAAETAWSAYLAPAGACSAADDAAAPVAAQARAVACLVNWARGQENRARLHRRSALQRAAELKGQSVASCGQFSHTPCGAPVTSGVNAWLNSPPHRANMMSGRFRHVGAAPVRASGLLGGGDVVVWTATFASPR